MKTAILTSFALFITLFSINAQSNFRPGYIITNKMDTIYGLIDFRTYKMNAHNCKFRVSQTSEDINYAPGDIFGYHFTDDGKYYVTKDIEIDHQPRKVFLEYLIQGVISLYFYPADESDYYFFQDESGKMSPVTQQDQKIITGKTGKTYIMDDDRYKWAVNDIFKKSKSVSKAVTKMSFNKKEMIDITKKYHAEMCTTGEECIQFETKKGTYVKVKVSVYAGMQMQTYKMGKRVLMDDAFISLINIEPDLLPVLTSFSPGFGAQINLGNPRWHKSLSLLLDLSLVQFKDVQERQKEEQINQFLRKRFSRTEIDGWIISGKLGGKYAFHNNGLFRPVIEGGFATNIMLASSSFLRTMTNMPDVHATVFTDNTIMPGFFLNAGVDYSLKKDNAVFFRVAFSRCYYLDLNDNLTSLQFNLGYTF